MRIRRPRTWLVRLLVAAYLLWLAGFVIRHFAVARGYGTAIQHIGTWIGFPVLIVWSASETSKALRRKPEGRPETSQLTGLAWAFGFGASQALIFLATQGSAIALGTRSAHVNSQGWLPSMEAYALALCLLYALFIGPEIVRRKLPFEHASAEALRLVPTGLAISAAVVTGSFLLVLHFFNQPMANVPPGPLTASIIAVMTLLMPFYQFIVRACWRDGLADFLDPAVWWAKWSTVTGEISSFAFHQAVRETGQESDAHDQLLDSVVR